jgi:uncharacterized phosphosugar-binding protein
MQTSETRDAASRYLAISAEIIQKIASTQVPAIEQTAQICADTIVRDGLVFCWGGGQAEWL